MPHASPSARELRDRFASHGGAAAEACDTALARIRAANGQLNAFLTVTDEPARRRAADLDGRTDKAACGPLAGVPIAIKDNICTRGVRTTAGSRMLEAYVPPYSATVIDRLERAGASVVGKTNCDEFAMGSSNEHSAFGAVRNPWDLERTPGGSSGGSAAAVAAGLVPLALGSDTGGSVRQPAGFCGVVGMRPTYGRVSRYGLVSFASSLDQIGPITTTVADAATALEVIAGRDERDSTTSDAAVPHWSEALTGDVRGCRIGVPEGLLEHGVDEDVVRAFGAAIGVFRNRGAVIESIGLPHADMAIPVYYVIATAEASSNLARYDGVRYGYRQTGADSIQDMYERTRDEGFGAEVKRRIIMGTFVLSAGYRDEYYARAQRARQVIAAEYDAALSRCDAILLPTSPTAAFRLGARVADPLQMYLSDAFTVGASLAGLPAVSVPCGFTAEHLPVGLQVVGRRFDEATVFRVAEAYERDTRWADARRPDAQAWGG